jgi:hypothetical protein
MATKVAFDLLQIVNPMNSSHYESQQEILTRIKFIGTIQPGEKLDTRNLRIETNTILTPVKRMFFGENRNTTMQFLSNTIERAFVILYSLANAEKISDKMICANIIKDIDKSIQGLMNMQKTYIDDNIFVCSLNTLIESVEARMTEVRQKFPDIVQFC